MNGPDIDGALTGPTSPPEPPSGVSVGVLVGVLVGVMVGVPVGVLVGVMVGVPVGVEVGVEVGVVVGVLVGVGVEVGVEVGVVVGVLVGVGVEVGVEVGVVVGVTVGVLVGVAVGVLVGVLVGAAAQAASELVAPRHPEGLSQVEGAPQKTRPPVQAALLIASQAPVLVSMQHPVACASTRCGDSSDNEAAIVSPTAPSASFLMHLNLNANRVGDGPTVRGFEPSPIFQACYWSRRRRRNINRAPASIDNASATSAGVETVGASPPHVRSSSLQRSGSGQVGPVFSLHIPLLSQTPSPSQKVPSSQMAPPDLNLQSIVQQDANVPFAGPPSHSSPESRL